MFDVWGVEKNPQDYGLAMMFMIEKEDKKCTVSVTQKKKMSIVTRMDGLAQNITIVNGVVCMNDAEYSDVNSSDLFERNFINVARKLPKEVRQLFGGNFEIN